MAANPYNPYNPYDPTRNPYNPKQAPQPYPVPGGHGGVTGGSIYGGYGMNQEPGDVPPDTSTPSGGGSAPSGGGSDPWAKPPRSDISQEAWDYWRKTNPGDESRWESAFPAPRGGGGGGGTSPYTSGGQGGYNTVTPFQEELRKILMAQLGAMGKTPTVDDPGIAENLAGRRLALQRSAERQRSAAAESLAGGGLATSGAAGTTRGSIEQQRGELEAQGVGQVLNAELSSRRQQLASLMNMALATGDAEAARIIQKQMQDDDLAWRYTQLQQQGNWQALMDILNASNAA